MREWWETKRAALTGEGDPAAEARRCLLDRLIGKWSAEIPPRVRSTLEDQHCSLLLWMREQSGGVRQQMEDLIRETRERYRE